MPTTWTYRQDTRERQAFFAAAREAMNLDSENATFAAVEGVLHCFRRQ